MHVGFEEVLDEGVLNCIPVFKLIKDPPNISFFSAQGQNLMGNHIIK